MPSEFLEEPACARTGAAAPEPLARQASSVFQKWDMHQRGQARHACPCVSPSHRPPPQHREAARPSCPSAVGLGEGLEAGQLRAPGCTGPSPPRGFPPHL